MENMLYVISGTLAAGGMIFFYWKMGQKLSDINFWRLIQELIIWSMVSAVVYIIIEYIFL